MNYEQPKVNVTTPCLEFLSARESDTDNLAWEFLPNDAGAPFTNIGVRHTRNDIADLSMRVPALPLLHLAKVPSLEIEKDVKQVRKVCQFRHFPYHVS